MGAPLRYRRECGPLALAAATGLSRAQAADLLWSARPLWLGGRRRPQGLATFGTPTRALADVLVRLGWGVEFRDGEGRLFADESILPRVLGDELHARLLAPPRRSREGGPEEDSEDAPEPNALRPLHAWLDLNRAGLWIYHLLVSPTEGSHVMPFYGPACLSGEAVAPFLDLDVLEALRLFQPSGWRPT